MSFGGPRVPNFRAKAAFESRVIGNESDSAKVNDDAIISPDRLIDLTDKMDASGSLNWEAPEGDWTILRIGHTSTGKDNAPAMAETRGLECDKLSREAVTKFFEKPGMLGTIIEDSKPLAGKSLQYVLMDSWEAGQQNWTPKFREDFKRLRGYDPQPWLPAITGRYVKGADETERFLWDFRRTIADLLTENHYALMHDMLHKYGMKLTSEAPGIGMPTVADELQCKGRTDIPMGEFWVGWQDDGSDPKEAASAAHIYAKTIAAAESFTATPENAGWKNDPYSLKIQGDREFCVGINRYVFHRYAHQPWLDRAPGMTMGPWGINFERTNTWWEPGKAWIDYISRCQFLLQQGLFVADLAYLYPEGAPQNFDPARLNPKPPQGHDFDGVNAEVVMTRMKVKDGMVVLPDGMSYRVLVLPDNNRMTPALLAKVKELIEAGATIVGPKPTKSPSLSNYPRCDDEVKSLADSIWGDVNGTDVTERKVGKGRIVWGKPIEEVLAVAPDFEATSPQGTPPLRYIHRRAGDTDIYFVSNQTDRAQYAECTFRVGGKLPELWYADTGKMETASVFSNENGRTTVPLRFDPSGSVFVIFSKSARGVEPVESVTRDGVSMIPLRVPQETASHTLEIKKATYGVLNGDKSLQRDVTKQLQAMVRDGTISVEASNKIAGDPAELKYKQLRVEYVYDGKPETITINEHSVFAVPDEVFPFTKNPAVEIQSLGGKTHRVTMWENGYFQIRSASGKIQNAKVMDLPEAQEVAGEWQVQFPPKLGAPAEITLERLISWTD
ncbi:MAG TPA: glycosyl hydrolase, partial [Tepidisphaeraceae bacterium]|nr:glycosyl hydrolase [Tepidisphaeraceae bacterium]